MRNETTITVRYAETDMMGVVYHANYLLYMEDARTAFLQELGFPYERIEEAGYMSPVVSLSCEYGRPLHYGEEAVMVTRVVKSTAIRTTYAYEVYPKGANQSVEKPLFSATSVHCIVSRETFEPISVKRVFPELFQAYAEAVEE